jgi:hypothetical protein
LKSFSENCWLFHNFEELFKKLLAFPEIQRAFQKTVGFSRILKSFSKNCWLFHNFEELFKKLLAFPEF